MESASALLTHLDNAGALNRSTLLNDPELLGAEAIDVLRSAIASHPYCAAYRVLYTIALGNVRSLQLPDTMRTTAAHVPDRFRLLTLTNRGEAEWLGLLADHNNRATQGAAEAADEGFSLIDRYLDHQTLPAGGELPAYDATAALQALEPLPDSDDASAPELADDAPDAAPEQTDQDALINSFIEAEQQGTLFVPDSPQPEQRAAEATVEKIRDSAFLTESLAKIYIKQHKYAQALSIIRDLSLKYPEKNVYFADQIRFLEKIIDYKTNKNN
jgi:hypothetical protein